MWLRCCSGRRRARPPARLSDRAALGAASRSPPVPSGPSGALHTGGACGSGVPGPRHRPRAPRPGPATAHGHCGQAPPPTGDLSFVVHRASLVRLFEPYLACLCLALKPTAPLLALPCSGMKPPSPLRAVKGHFWAKSNLQRCWRFQSGVQRGVQRCWRFQRCPVIVSCARKSSPCISRSCRGARKSSPCKLKAGEKRCFLVCWANFFAEVLWDGLRWASIFAEEPLRSLIVNMSMCVRSPCGGRSSAGEQFCMQFPSRHFE